MTREQAKQLLPIITAFADGEIIQSYGSEWIDCTESPAFNLSADRYRVKPNPREWHLTLCGMAIFASVYDQPFPANETIHVREVLP